MKKQVSFNVENYSQWKAARELILSDMKKRKHINKANAKLIMELHAEIFDHKPQRPCCPNAWVDAINVLDSLYDKYNTDNNIIEEVEITTDPVEELRVGEDMYAVGNPRDGAGKLVDMDIINGTDKVEEPPKPKPKPRPRKRASGQKRKK